jgi:hypothetical protein
VRGGSSRAQEAANPDRKVMRFPVGLKESRR